MVVWKEYEKGLNTPKGATLADLMRSTLMIIYQKNNPDALENDMTMVRDEIEKINA